MTIVQFFNRTKGYISRIRGIKKKIQENDLHSYFITQVHGS